MEETNAAAAGPPGAPGGGRDRGLFDGDPPVEREAAAAFISLGINPRRARGLVTEYRPTPQQARNIAANVLAKQQAAERGESDRIRDIYGFVRAQCREGCYSLDDRVHEARRRAEVKARREARAREHAGQAQVKRIEVEAVTQAENQAWDSLSEADKIRLREKALCCMPASVSKFHERLKHDHRMIRGLILAEAAKGTEKT